MSKQLGAILNRVPPATARPTPITVTPATPKAPVLANSRAREVPLQVLVPEHVRMQLGEIANKERTSLRAVVLRAVRSLGIEITDEEIKDKRGRKS
jgi:hypothetical protein